MTQMTQMLIGSQARPCLLPLRLPLLLPLLLLLGSKAWSQTKIQGPGTRIEILGADAWTFDKAIAPGAQRLIGNARFKHEGAVMGCDSAYIYEDQRVEAFGRIADIVATNVRHLERGTPLVHRLA
jgi:hypothetical protein